MGTSHIIEYMTRCLLLYYSDLSWARVADLARFAFQAEAEGDSVARRLLTQAATDLAAAVTAHTLPAFICACI
jgi:N-acetylglucosamine kinase-like BadF-type ATPase